MVLFCLGNQYNESLLKVEKNKYTNKLCIEIYLLLIILYTFAFKLNRLQNERLKSNQSCTRRKEANG